jgi:hypothetical protein
MQSGGAVSGLVASVLGVKPSAEYPDGIIETVGGADDDESLTGAYSAETA